MTKKQKIWMWIFTAMFVVPEILWNPVSNFIYSFFSKPNNGLPQLLRDSFLFNYQYENLLKTIITIQLIGIISFFILWLKNKNNINSRIIFWIILLLSLLISLVSLFILYLVFVFSLNFF